MTDEPSSRSLSNTATVVVHDFSGHPFQVQLARHMAERGTTTTHLYCPSFQTPKGNVDDEGADSGFRSEGVALRKEFNKYSSVKRFFQEVEYGVQLSRAVRRIDPDVVISSNTPLLAALVFQLAMKLQRRPVVFWQQDVYSLAMANHLDGMSGLLGPLGRLVGWVFTHIERWLLKSSDAVVVISEDFLDTLRGWNVDLDHVDVIENWAPIAELPLGERRNAWSEAHGIGDDDIVLLYSGTLGLKHEPSVLLDLARAMRDRENVRVIVASEGIGANWLEDQRQPGDRLELIGFQPYDELPSMLASADVLMVLLEADAGGFSVPSKVLTYHCAGRAILGAMPAENLATRNMISTGSGVVVDPGDSAAFVAAATALVDDADRRAEMGRLARRYAEATFDIDRICDRFEHIAAGVIPRTER